jgi:hypothetical protein
VGFDVAMHIAIVSDREIMLPYFLTIYKCLTPTPINVKLVAIVLPKLGVFTYLVSTIVSKGCP